MASLIYPLLFKPIWRNAENVERTPTLLDDFCAAGQLTPGAAAVDECRFFAPELFDELEIANGSEHGGTLRALVEKVPRRILGRHFADSGVFPMSLAVKALVQDTELLIHPDRETAARFGAADSECAKFWYSLAAARGARAFLGLASRASGQQLRQHLDGIQAYDYLQRFNVRAGDSYLIPPGTVHALTGEQLLLEMATSEQAPLRLTGWHDGSRPGAAESALALASLNTESRQSIRMPKVRNAANHTRRIPLSSHYPFFVAEEIRLYDHMYLESDNDGCELMFSLGGSFVIEHANGRESIPAGRLCLVPAELGAFKLLIEKQDADCVEVLRFGYAPK